MAYQAPVNDLVFSLKHAAGFARARTDGPTPTSTMRCLAQC